MRPRVVMKYRAYELIHHRKYDITQPHMCPVCGQDVIDAHAFSINNEAELMSETKCGCFYCLEIFNPKEIEEWCDDAVGTALCPFCGIDSVIGESSGYPITKEFLQAMHEFWF